MTCLSTLLNPPRQFNFLIMTEKGDGTNLTEIQPNRIAHLCGLRLIFLLKTNIITLCLIIFMILLEAFWKRRTFFTKSSCRQMTKASSIRSCRRAITQ